MKLPRIALFSDSYHEANGIARTAVAIEACARRRNMPLLSVHPGPETRLVHDGSIVRLDLARSGLCSFGLEHGLRFDPAMWRHAGRAASETDTVSNAVLESMASGVPAVVMAADGQRFVVETEQTAIVADGPDAFAQGVRALVKDRRRREAMGVAARAHAMELLSWDRIFIDMCAAYEAAISPAESERRNRAVLSPA